MAAISACHLGLRLGRYRHCCWPRSACRAPSLASPPLLELARPLAKVTLWPLVSMEIALLLFTILAE